MTQYWSLCINLQGPMQAWGVESKLTFKSTSLAPSKSGVIGIIASSLGIERNNIDYLSKLSQLKFATVCLEKKPKFILKDYHTISDVSQCNGKIKDTELTDRFYLIDWHFLAIIEGDNQLLEKIKYALQYPKWHVFLGRKCCPPASPFIYKNALKECSIEDLLSINGDYLCYKETNITNKILNSKSEFDDVISYEDRTFSKKTYFEDRIDLIKLQDTIFPLKEQKNAILHEN
ncbi:type I-E CRISPR-associated protein Cas5/CasD [Silvanigrella aquatica]|uniref:Type I-E CRISPR-associated protein Cas5/CasD n=1 Tax=Silvanigrella aquatica TaxID=1915309 RepID=A0A1L4CXW2_9BACT|nr:type I-E CRISPR-associated protein Cas5/CasD [Silvanigrella aquatica]APJ02801.1 type I-E CRISPR-associated protein Cas5/CasD [Silvanigrella aquatica]